MFAGQAKRIKDLHLVPALHVDATVTAALSTTGRGVIQLELHVQVEVTKVPETCHSLAEQSILQSPPLEVLGGRTVKEHDGSLWSLGAHRHAAPNRLFGRARVAITGLVDNLALLPGSRSLRPILPTFELDNVALADSGHRNLLLAGPTRTGQSPGIHHADALPPTQGPDLDPDL